MKKLAYAFCLFAALLAVPAFAGDVKTGKAPGSAHTIVIDGNIIITGYYRDEAINMVLDQDGFPDGVGFPSPEEFNASDVAYLVEYNFGLTSELADKVTGRIVVGNKPIAGVGSDFSINDSIGDGFIDTELLQAYVTVEEFLAKSLTFSIGIMDLKYELRGPAKGAFYLDLRNAESSFLSPTTEAFAGEAYAYDTFGELAFGGGGFAGLTKTRNGTAGGWKMTYNDSDTVYVDLFAFTVAESLTAGGGASAGNADEALYGVNLDYLFDKQGDRKSLFSAIFTLNTNDQAISKLYTLGIGVDYFVDRWELYGELYYQFGDYGYITPVDFAGGAWGGNETVDQSAWAGYVGTAYNFESDYKPYLDLSFWYLTGDEGDVDDTGTIENEDFVSYECNKSSMILEDSTFGLDVDSNYWAIKLQGGFTTTTGLKKDDLAFTLFYGFFQLVEEPNRMFMGAAALDRDIEKDLGNEVDLKVAWTYNESLSFTFGAGWLFGADFFGDRTTPAQTLAGIAGGYETGEDNMQLYTFTTELTF